MRSCPREEKIIASDEVLRKLCEKNGTPNSSLLFSHPRSHLLFLSSLSLSNQEVLSETSNLQPPAFAFNFRLSYRVCLYSPPIQRSLRCQQSSHWCWWQRPRLQLWKSQLERNGVRSWDSELPIEERTGEEKREPSPAEVKRKEEAQLVTSILLFWTRPEGIGVIEHRLMLLYWRARVWKRRTLWSAETLPPNESP